MIGTGDITAVSAGMGLTGVGTNGSLTINADTSVLQSRVTGTCSAGNAIRIISGDGTVTCEVIGTPGPDGGERRYGVDGLRHPGALPSPGTPLSSRGV